MEQWRVCWREGFAPLLSTEHLEVLRLALVNDDSRLLQGVTTEPPPLQCVQDWPVEGACAVSYAGWKGDGLETVAEVEEFFAKCCFAADQRLQEPAGCRWFLNFWDDNPRETVFKEVLQEVQRTLAERLAGEATTGDTDVA